MMKVSTDSSTFCPLNHLALHSKSIRKASTCPHGITIKVQIIGIKTSMPSMKVIRVSIDTPISYHILTKRAKLLIKLPKLMHKRCFIVS